MVMQAGLRPEWLDFQVFRRVKLQMQSVEHVGDVMRMPPHLIARWVERIMVYLLTTQNAGPSDDPLMPAAEKRLALRLCSERLNHLVTLALRAFVESQGTQTTERQRGNGERTLVTVNSPGDPRYLSLAATLMEKMSDLPPPTLAVEFVHNDLPNGEDQYATFAAAALQLSPTEAAEVRRQYQQAHGQDDEDLLFQSGKNNPNGECSEDVAEQAEQDEDDDGGPYATPEEIADFVEMVRAHKAAERANLRPVQPDTQGGADSSLPDETKAARKAFFAGGT